MSFQRKGVTLQKSKARRRPRLEIRTDHEKPVQSQNIHKVLPIKVEGLGELSFHFCMREVVMPEYPTRAEHSRSLRISAMATVPEALKRFKTACTAFEK